jgi:hypothetical protein
MEAFDKKILNSKSIKVYDISSIDYDFIEKLYNKKITDDVKYRKQGHERVKFGVSYDKYVGDLDMDTYYNYDIDIKYFYNEETKKKVHEFYKKDLDFLYEMGIDYINTEF